MESPAQLGEMRLKGKIVRVESSGTLWEDGKVGARILEG